MSALVCSEFRLLLSSANEAYKSFLSIIMSLNLLCLLPADGFPSNRFSEYMAIVLIGIGAVVCCS